jgi:hypothetical protein
MNTGLQSRVVMTEEEEEMASEAEGDRRPVTESEPLDAAPSGGGSEKSSGAGSRGKKQKSATPSPAGPKGPKRPKPGPGKGPGKLGHFASLLES